MSTTELPFLLTNGTWLWKTALAGFVLIALGMFLAVRWWRRHAKVRAALAPMAKVIAPDEVRGVLCSATPPAQATGLAAGMRPVLATTMFAESTEYDAAWIDLRAAEVRLLAEDGRQIELDGPIRIFVGSTTATARSGVPAELRDDELARATEQAPWLHRPDVAETKVWRATVARLREGDQVTLRGTLVRAPGDGETGFREAATAWRLQAPGGAIAAAMQRPRPAPAPLPVLALAGVAVIAGLLGYSVERWLGASWMEQCAQERNAAMLRDTNEPVPPVDFSSRHACAKVAATPGRRDLGLAAMTSILEASPERDEVWFQRVVAVSHLSEGCEYTVGFQLRHQRYEDASELAKRCGQRRLQHQALVAQGRYEEAAAISVPGTEAEPALPQLSTLLAAGRWREAAPALDALAKTRASHTEDPEHQALLTAYYECLALYARHHAGDPQALPALALRADSAHGQPCVPVLAELDPVKAPELLAKHLRERSDRPSMTSATRMIDDLALAAGISRQHTFFGAEPEHVLCNPSRIQPSEWAALAWLVSSAADQPAPADPVTKIHRLRWQTVAHAMDGDLPAAERSAAEAMALAAPLANPDLRDLQMLAPSARLYSPRTELGASFEVTAQLPADPDSVNWQRKAWLQRFGHLLAREGKPLADAYLGPEPALPAALAPTQEGNGIPLADHMLGRPRHTSWWRDDDILSVLPRLRSGRERIAHLLVWHAQPSWRTETSPFAAALHAFARREVLTLAGAPGEAARWDRIYRRVDEVLGDRKRLVALMLLEK
ncbi:MAG: hypothetical protein IPI49_06495 [Myxococcales bacterium]|nr:hypothetical protein [Myxococcales bacterium]